MQTTANARRPLQIQNRENSVIAKSKLPAMKTGVQAGLKPRTALGSINSNVQQIPVMTFGKPSLAGAEKDKKPVIKSYRNVPSKIDSGLPSSKTLVTTRSAMLQNKENFDARPPTVQLQKAQNVQIKVNSVMPMKTRMMVRKESRSDKFIDDAVVDLENQIKKLEPTKETSRRLSSYSTALLAENVKDIDASQEKSPILMSVYIKDIYAYLHELEMKFRIRPRHLEGHVIITSRMRELLIDWLIEVHHAFNLMLETLHMTIAIIDRYLQMDKSIKKVELQLLGVTAMFIASKYEEMYAPDISDFVVITDNTYTKHDIIRFEKQILVKLDFSFGRPLPLHFLRRYVKAAELTFNHHNLSKYLIELSFLSYELAHCHPSEIAAACVCLSIALLSSNSSFKECWDDTLTYYSGYSFEHISDSVEKIATLLSNIDKSKCRSATKKYNNSKYRKISSHPQLQFVKTCLKHSKEFVDERCKNTMSVLKPLYVI